MHETYDIAQVNLPDSYLAAIGRVCCQWSNLEAIVDLAIKKLLNFDLEDYRIIAITAHMSWPAKINLLGTLISEYKNKHPHLEEFSSIKPILTAAQVSRNKIIHATWGYENDQAVMLRASARGQLKTYTEPMSVEDIEKISSQIGKSSILVYRLIFQGGNKKTPY